jgi:hypothetical protein
MATVEVLLGAMTRPITGINATARKNDQKALLLNLSRNVGQRGRSSTYEPVTRAVSEAITMVNSSSSTGFGTCI